MRTFGIRRFLLIFLIAGFLSLHYASTLYINSSYLAQFLSPGWVSVLFAVGALFNIILFLNIPKLLRNISKRTLFWTFLTLEAITTLGLAMSWNGLQAAIFFSVYSATLPMLYYLLDISLEENTLDTNTGEIRGLYLTLQNAAIALGPLFVASFGNSLGIGRLYFVALALLGPIFIFFLIFKPVGLPKRPTEVRLPFRAWRENSDVYRVSLARFVLNFFYALMVIFVPIYLHEVIGFNWEKIGVMFTVMLTAFVIFEWPIGEVEDRFWGEKEIMTLGFFVMGTSLLFMPFLGKNFLAWTIVLFASRVGASWTEVSTESYFFKKIGAGDSGLISIFRLASPASTIAGAMLGAVMLEFLPFNLMFFFLAGAVFLGMKESLFIHDTR